jgi:hypothetical protein
MIIEISIGAKEMMGNRGNNIENEKETMERKGNKKIMKKKKILTSIILLVTENN